LSDQPTLDAILADLLGGAHDLRRLARKHRITLDELCRLLDSPATAAALRIVTLAGDASAAIAIGKARHSAIASLKKIATDTDNPEPARKASVDLIKAAPAPLAPPPPQQPAGDEHTDRLDEATQDLIRQALAAFEPQPPEADA